MADVTPTPLGGQTIQASEIGRLFERYLKLGGRHVSGYNIVTADDSYDVSIEPGEAVVGEDDLRLVGDPDGAHGDADSTTTKTLPANDTSHIFLKRDGNFEINQTGTQPANSIKLWEVTTDGSGVSDTTDKRDDTAHIDDPLQTNKVTLDNGIIDTPAGSGTAVKLEAEEMTNQFVARADGDVSAKNSMLVGGVGSPSGALEVKGGPLNLSASDNIQDAGTDAIQLDGSQNVTLPNGSLTVDGGAINLSSSNNIQDAGTDAIQFDGSQNVTIPNGSFTASGASTLTGDVTLQQATIDYKVTANSNERLHIEPVNNNRNEIVYAIPSSDGTDPLIHSIMAVGRLGDTDTEGLRYGYFTSDNTYHFQTTASGSGSHRSIKLESGDNSDQFVVETNGDLLVGAAASGQAYRLTEGGNSRILQIRGQSSTDNAIWSWNNQDADGSVDVRHRIMGFGASSGAQDNEILEFGFFSARSQYELRSTSQGAGSQRPIALAAESGTPPTQLVLATDGNVGIGTSSPGRLLDVSGTLTASDIHGDQIGADPSLDPASFAFYQSDGSSDIAGDQDDVILAANNGDGTTRQKILYDWSADSISFEASKTNLEPFAVDTSAYLDLDTYTWDYKERVAENSRAGFLSEDLAEVHPRLVEWKAYENLPVQHKAVIEDEYGPGDEVPLEVDATALAAVNHDILSDHDDELSRLQERVEELERRNEVLRSAVEEEGIEVAA